MLRIATKQLGMVSPELLKSILPGVILLAAGGVDGLLVEESGHVLPDAAQDANKSVMQLHWRVLQKDKVA